MRGFFRIIYCNQNDMGAKKFTKLQREEILHAIHVRQDTIEDDIESASPFEAKVGALEALEEKIEKGDMNFTAEEREWLGGEIDNLIDIAYANEGTEGVKVFGLANSMQNAIDKL